MAQQLDTVIEQANALSANDQLALIAHLAQAIKITNEPTDNINSVELNEGINTSSSAVTSILKITSAFASNVPEEVLEQLPSDGAEQHDHYIYGTPKIQL